MATRPLGSFSDSACLMCVRFLVPTSGFTGVCLFLFVYLHRWFKNRVDAKSGLGDWTLDENKFPFGMEALARDVHATGLHLGVRLSLDVAWPLPLVFVERPFVLLCHAFSVVLLWRASLLAYSSALALLFAMT